METTQETPKVKRSRGKGSKGDKVKSKATKAAKPTEADNGALKSKSTKAAEPADADYGGVSLAGSDAGVQVLPYPPPHHPTPIPVQHSVLIRNHSPPFPLPQ